MRNHTRRNDGVAVMAEIVAVLSRYPDLAVTPAVEVDDGVLTLQVVVHPRDDGDRLRALDAATELRYVADVAQVRAIAARYDIDPSLLEPFIGRAKEGA